jgi:Uma2 family endonuclease
MTTTSKWMTADELLRLPDDHHRHELVKGELRTMPPSGHEHGEIVMNISGPLHLFVRAKKLGKTYGAETGFLIGRNPDTVLAPDLSYVSKKRALAARSKKGFFPGVPDLAVEVVSPGDTVQEMDDKVQEWLEAGTPLVWVINPKRQTVTVYDSPAGSHILKTEDELRGGKVVPGFSLPVSAIFED